MQQFLPMLLIWAFALACSCAPQDLVRSSHNRRDLHTERLDPELLPRPSSGFRFVGVPPVSVSRENSDVTLYAHSPPHPSGITLLSARLWHRVLAAASSSSASSSANSGGVSSSSSVGGQPTSPQSSNSGGSGSDGGLSTGGIIGTVFGVVAAALGLGTAIFQWLKSRRDEETVESAKKPSA